jgi:hypothetical protein
MPEVNSPASASPSMLAGMNAPPPDSGDSMSGRIPGSGSPDQAGGQPPSQGGSADAKLNTDIKTLRQMEASLTDMAQSYPTATKALRAAADALRSAQRQIVSNPGTADPPVPNTTA